MASTSSAVLYVMRNEDRKLSGVVTTDRGGKTRFGIAQKYHPSIAPSFYTCPALDALAQAQQIYTSDYAKPLSLASISSQPIANKLLDVAINCGTGISATMAQTGANNLGAKLRVDGSLGPVSIAAINGVDSGRLMGQLIVLSQTHYREVAARDHATPNEIASWLTRAGRPGI